MYPCISGPLKYKQIVSFSVPDTIYKKCEFLQPLSIEGGSIFLASSKNYCSGFITSKKNKERIIVFSATQSHPRHQQARLEPLFYERSTLCFLSWLTLPKTGCTTRVEGDPQAARLLACLRVKLEWGKLLAIKSALVEEDNT